MTSWSMPPVKGRMLGNGLIESFVTYRMGLGGSLRDFLNNITWFV